jgi:hypothetical protein
MEAVKI